MIPTDQKYSEISIALEGRQQTYAGVVSGKTFSPGRISNLNCALELSEERMN